MTSVGKHTSTHPTKGRATGPGRAARKEDKRARIRDAAFELFTTKGFDTTTLAEVATRAGVAKGTLFLYASDKDDLVCLVMHDRLAATVDRAWDSMPRGATLDVALVHVFGTLLRGYGEVPELARAFVRVFTSARGPNGRRVGALTFGFLFRLAGLVSDAKARGEVADDVDENRAAQNFFALYFASILFWLSGYGNIEDAMETQLRASLALQMRGLRP